jgi:hypothetical protein
MAIKKPIIGAKKKAAKARMADVKKIPSRGLAPTDKSVARKNAASEASSVKPKGISAKPMTEFPDRHFGAVPTSMSGEGMEYYANHMKIHGDAVKKGVDKINMKKRMSPIERDIKKQAIMKEYQSGSAKSTKSAPKKPMAKAKSKSMPVKKSTAKSTK